MTVLFHFNIYQEDYHNAGCATSDIKRYLTQIGVNPVTIRKIVICSYEAEMNQVIHSYGGEMTLEIVDHKIYICAKDKGPGILHVKEALKPGYSTASEKVRKLGYGAGMGLPLMKKNSETFEIESNPLGTKVLLSWVLI